MLPRIIDRLVFSSALASILLANFACLAILNGLTLPPLFTLAVWPAALAAAWCWLRRAVVKRPQWHAGPAVCAMVVAAVVLVAAPRAAYLLEWLPANPVMAQADDYAHLAELIAMTASPRYPLLHPSNGAYLLSHYYATFYPMAFLKLAVPVLTLKDCLFFGNALYALLFALSVLEAATRWMRNARAGAVFVFLCTLFGGFDWLFFANRLFAHAEPWASSLFHGARQISAFYSGMYWVVHHFAGFWGVALALLVFGCSRFRTRLEKQLAVGALLLAAFYASPFAFLPAVLLAAPQLLRLWNAKAMAVLGAVGMVPLFLFTHRVQPGSFAFAPAHLNVAGDGWLDAALSLAVYVPLVCVVDLAGLPFIATLGWRTLGRAQRWWLAGAWLYLLSTFFVESIGSNNYSMRGMFLPSLVFFALGARVVARWPGRVRYALALLLCIGTVKEAATNLYAPLMHSRAYWRAMGRAVPAQVEAALCDGCRDIARGKAVERLPVEGDAKFNAERLGTATPIERMSNAERELLRHPRVNFFW